MKSSTKIVHEIFPEIVPETVPKIVHKMGQEIKLCPKILAKSLSEIFAYHQMLILFYLMKQTNSLSKCFLCV